MKDLKYEHQSIFPCGEGSNFYVKKTITHPDGFV